MMIRTCNVVYAYHKHVPSCIGGCCVVCKSGSLIGSTVSDGANAEGG